MVIMAASYFPTHFLLEAINIYKTFHPVTWGLFRQILESIAKFYLS